MLIIKIKPIKPLKSPAAIDNEKSPYELIKKGSDPDLVENISKRIALNEYKIKQINIIIK